MGLNFLSGGGLAEQLLRGGMGSFLIRVLEVCLNLVVVMMLARLLGASGYGLYAFVFALISFASMLSLIGLPSLVVRETARGQRIRDWSAVRGVWRWATVMALSLSLLMAAGGALGLWLGLVHGESLCQTLVWGLGLVPLFALVAVSSASLRGLRHVLAGVFPEQVLRPAMLAGALLAVLVWPVIEFSPADAMGLTLGAAFVAFIAGAALLHYYRPPEVPLARPRYQHARWLAAAWPMGLTQGFQQINRYADVLLLGVLAASADVGVYRVAAQGALLVSLGLTTLDMVVGPFAARMHVEDERHKLQKLARRTAQAALAFAVPAMVLFVMFGEWLLVTLFGDEFQSAYWALVVLASGQLVNAGFGPTGMLLNMTGHEREVTRAAAVAAGLNVVLNLLLIPPFGVIGAAVATTVSLGFWNVWLWLVVRWRLGIRCSAI